MSDLNELKLCVDRVIPPVADPMQAAVEQALLDVHDRIAARRAEAGAERATDGSGVIPVERMALVAVKKWPDGKTLRCRFLDGSAVQHQRVEQKARLWEPHANIRLAFGNDADAEVRISFSEPGSWSAVGTDCLVREYFPLHQPTMNFGWLKDDGQDEEYERVVVHEFGHALGAIHEHQQPHADLKWNKPVVYRVFSGAPNYWTKEQIDHNIFDRYSVGQTNSTAFDAKSIMLYAFSATLFLDGHGTRSNTHLSDTDKAFIAEMYPRPGAGRPRTLRLRTPYLEGDDVSSLQRRLLDQGYGPTGAAGVYDSETATALRRFQRAQHLRADGIFGPKTRKALESLPG